MDLVTREKKNEKKLKKAFRLKLLELCKTRTKKSTRDMFNFFVVLAAHDMVTDADRATTFRCKFKAPHFKQKIQKMNDLPKIWVSPKIRLKISEEKT